MKILYVLHQFYPRYITGTEQYVLSLAQEGRRRGHEMVILCLEPDFLMGPPGLKVFREDYEGFEVHRISVGNFLFANPVLAEFDNPVVLQVVNELLDQLKPDAAHVFHLRYLGARILDLIRSRRIPLALNLMDFWFLCPHVTLLTPGGRLCDGPDSEPAHCLSCGYRDLHQHVGEVGENWDRHRPQYSKGSLRHSDGLGDLYLAASHRADFLRHRFQKAQVVLAPSRFLKQTYEANGFSHPELRVLTYGVEMGRLSGFQKVPHSSAGLRIGYMGTIAHHKGLHVLIEAFLGVESERASLHIYGRLEDYPEYAADRKHQAQGDERIHFHGGFPAPELGRVLGEIDVLVVPSLWYENTPFVVLEALAAKIPVVTSRLGGMTEAIKEGETGFSFEAENAAELKEILTRLSQEPNLVPTLSDQIEAPKTLADNFREMESLYVEMQGMNDSTPSEPSPQAGSQKAPTVEELQAALEVRDQQVKDLYDQLMSLTARWLREKPDVPRGES